MYVIAKPRILFLLHLPPPVHGSSLVGLNIKESIEINKAFECNFINLLASQNIAESGKVNFRKILEFINTFFRLLQSVIREKPALVYLALTTTGAAFYKDVLLVALLKVFQVKRVYHLHNKGVSLHQNQFFSRLCYRFVFKNADVILLSKHLYTDIQQFVPENRIHICPNGIKDDARNKKQETIQKKNIKILFLSNLIESKGVFVLLEALALLKQSGICFECIFIGGEGDINAAKFNDKVSHLRLITCVNYLGKKYGEEKEKAFSEADIFVFPTYYETFGLVNLEAMQYSLPIVSTFEGGIPDVVVDKVTGFLVPQQNVELLAEKIEMLINNPELRQQMGKAGRRKYEKEFTLDRFERRMEDILQKMV